MTTVKNNIQIDILDYDPNVQNHRQRSTDKGRWVFVFPWWIDYAVEDRDLAEPWRGDFADLCQFACDKGWIEWYCNEMPNGQVSIPGTTEVRWSPEKQDVVETNTGSYLLTFEEFLKDFICDNDLIEFIQHYIKNK